MSNFARQIENRNFLSPVGFKFSLNRSPKVAFFCNKANIPDISLGTTVQPNYYRPIPQPGEIVEFGDLNVRFMVDEDLENYLEIQNWIRGLGFPENSTQFSNLHEEGESLMSTQEYKKNKINWGFGHNIYSDGTLQVLGSNFTPKFEINFKDLFPYTLTTLEFDATDTDIEYFTAEVGFKYTMYSILDKEGRPL